MASKKPVWCNPDWSKARVKTATEEMMCFGLGCPRKTIKIGEHYTLHRIKASGFYADRAFCTECHPVREMPPGFDPHEEWQKTMSQHERDWLAQQPPVETFGPSIRITQW